jgi:hypothetical protein
MSARLTIQGLEELRAALRRLPEDLAGEAAHLIEARGNGAVATIKAGYPKRSGELRDKLAVTHTRSRVGARSVIRNTSKHALPFDVGTQAARQTRGGANRGSAPANPIFSQTIRRERRGLQDDLRDLLVRHGLLVTDA